MKMENYFTRRPTTCNFNYDLCDQSKDTFFTHDKDVMNEPYAKELCTQKLRKHTINGRKDTKNRQKTGN